VRIIQMGMGTMGDHWLKTVRAFKGVTHAGFVEIVPEIAKAQSEKYEIDPRNIFRSLGEALESVEADGVLAVIPPQFRVEIAGICADARMPLLSEKPLAGNMVDAHEVVRIFNESGVLCMVAQDYRYSAQAQTLKRILDSGELGKVGAISAEHYQGLNFVGFHALMPYPLLQDMSIHHFDLMRFFLNAEPERIVAESWQPTWQATPGMASVRAWLTFPEDVRVTYTASWSANGIPTSWTGNWRFDCERGTILLRDDLISVQQKKGDREARWYEYDVMAPVDADPIPYMRQAYLLNEFKKAVETGSQPATICQDNIKSLQMVFDTIAASEVGISTR